VRISELEPRPAFALLGPGFTGGGWALLTDLRPATGPPALLFAAYEADAADVVRLEGTRRDLPGVELDVSPAALAPELDAAGHGEAVAAIRAAIAAGDVYQVCFTVRARLAAVSGAGLLAAMSRRGLPRFAAWVRLPGGPELVSASPELLFAIDGDRIRCEPMKGTAPADGAGDLTDSDKDWAELAMITDLVRNDLTPVCRPRSVRVRDARRLIALPYAVQTVSDVEGTLLPGTTALDALAALHPGGSVTGAPKRAAREMIRRLERSPRGAYCGALGLCRADRAVVSLLIRTASRDERGWVYGTGGGIVYDSDAARELEEVRVKLGALG
jgi:anthranilate/para-aminobenzoate synthase component I